MSLIYSALSSMDKKHVAEVTPDGQPVFARAYPRDQKSSVRWFYLAGLMVVIVAGAVSLQRSSAMKADPKIDTSPLVASVADVQPQSFPIQQTVPLAVHQLAEDVATKNEAEAQLSTPQSKSQPFKLKQSKTAATLPLVAKNKSERPELIVHSTVGTVSKPIHETPASANTEQLTMVAMQAINAGDEALATETIAKLTRIFPAESITLLRLRAWQAMHNDERALAISLYGQIVDRLPDDESSSINLAVLNWKAGNHDEARHIIGRLAALHPDSDRVQSYINKF